MYHPFLWLFYVCLLFGEFSTSQGCYLLLWLGVFLLVLLLCVIRGNFYQYCCSLLWFRETEIRQYLTFCIYFWRNKPEVNITFCCYFYIMIHWMLNLFSFQKNLKKVSSFLIYKLKIDDQSPHILCINVYYRNNQLTGNTLWLLHFLKKTTTAKFW